MCCLAFSILDPLSFLFMETNILSAFLIPLLRDCPRTFGSVVVPFALFLLSVNGQSRCGQKLKKREEKTWRKSCLSFYARVRRCVYYLVVSQRLDDCGTRKNLNSICNKCQFLTPATYFQKTEKKKKKVDVLSFI